MSTYQEIYDLSVNQPDEFWAEAAQAIHWYKQPTKILDDSRKPFYRWFADGELNTCYNALDRHVEAGRGEQLAVIYDSPVTQTIKKITYQQMRDEVAKFAGVLRNLGVQKGDRVIIYMPMIPEALFGMYACARIGAIHSVVFGGFASKELATRINDAKPVVILSASCGIEGQKVIPYKPLLDEAIDLSDHKPQKCVIFQRPQIAANLHAGRDVEWQAEMATAQPVDCVPVAATDPLYILYTSGTTGIPKGVVRDNGGHGGYELVDEAPFITCSLVRYFGSRRTWGWVVDTRILCMRH
ncbi:MAG: AMP-binding protein [Thiotrichaceae bacterium]